MGLLGQALLPLLRLCASLLGCLVESPAFELLALVARAHKSRHFGGNNVSTLFADKVGPLGNHDPELVPVNTVRTAYRILHLGALISFSCASSPLPFSSCPRPLRPS